MGSGTPWAAQQALTGPHDPVWAAPAQRGPEDGDTPRRELGLVQSLGQVGLPRCLAEQPAPSMLFPSACCAPRGRADVESRVCRGPRPAAPLRIPVLGLGGPHFFPCESWRFIS